MRLGPPLAARLLAGLTLSAPGAELFGRPLRGLSPVSIAELVRKAADYDGRTVRVRGTVRSEKGAFRLVEAGDALRLTMRDADSALPSDADGATAAAEGTFRANGPGGAPALEATGLELTR